MKEPKVLPAVCTLAALTILLYLPLLTGGWMSDDFVHIAQLRHQPFAHIFGTPDVFHYYRPIPQATFLATLRLVGERSAVFRATNLLLHAAAVVAAYAAARPVLSSARAAALAAVAFALTPKAAQMAVLWTSARPELLMALCSLLAIASWARWIDDGPARWAAATAVCCAGAVLSKESALLLPLLLIALPVRGRISRRCGGGVLLLAVAGAAVAARAYFGAWGLLGSSSYQPFVSPVVYAANIQNYLMRGIWAPAALLVAVALSSSASARRSAAARLRSPRFARTLLFGIAWFLLLIAPVLPMLSRSELYLYLPVFGLCLVSGEINDALIGGALPQRTRVALGLVIVALGGYQMVVATRTHQILVFSDALVSALGADAPQNAPSSRLVIVPADASADRLLHGSVGGYAAIVMRHFTGRADVEAAIAYGGEPTPTGTRYVRCSYSDGAATLTQVGPPR